jgi:hypothetical protein
MRNRWLVVSLLAACAADGADSGHWSTGKGDGVFDLVEAGPAPVGDEIDIALDHRVPAYRVESYGKTHVAIELAGHDTDAHVVVEGPLPGDGDKVAVGSGTVVGETGGRDAKLDLVLDQPGVYRILAGTEDSLGHGQAATGTLTLSVTCSANCWRAELDQKSFVHLLQQQGGAALADAAKAELGQLVPDTATADQLGAQLDAILADPNLTGLDRFPLIPMSSIAVLRPALGALQSKAPEPDKVITGDLVQLLGSCTPDRSLPADVDPRLPGVKYAQFPSKTLSPCQFAHAGKLAAILTSLAAQNGSSVTFQGKTITSPRELFEALVASGHKIEVRNERMYANFLSMVVGDRDLIWPVWIDTGMQLSSGDSFTIPVGHSHHAWRITGPIVDTRVMFYLGTSGAGFFGQTDQRPAWSGSIAEYKSTDSELVMATVDAAGEYLRRNRVERSTVAAGMPADGYGYLGVCNDSNTTIEYATRGTITAFPLLRAKELDSQPDLGDGLDDVVRALPKDGDGLTDPADALSRAVAMQPFPDGSPLMWDSVLGAQIATARHDLGK